MLVSLASPQEMPGMSLPACISLSWRRSSDAAADVAPAMVGAMSGRWLVGVLRCGEGM